MLSHHRLSGRSWSAFTNYCIVYHILKLIGFLFYFFYLLIFWSFVHNRVSWLYINFWAYVEISSSQHIILNHIGKDNHKTQEHNELTDATDSTPVSCQLRVGSRAKPSLGAAELRVSTQVLKNIMQRGNDNKMLSQSKLTILIIQLLVGDQHLCVMR